MPRIEINPGEFFMVADGMVLVDEYESVLGDVSKLGSADGRIAYLFTFSGKVNNRDERTTVTLAMPVQDAFKLAGQILDGLELLAKHNRKK